MNIFKKKTVEQLNNTVGNAINTFAIKGRVRIIGSNALRSTQYGSDYDIDTMIDNVSPSRIAKLLQDAYTTASKDKDVWIIDFKCGIDERLEYAKGEDYSDASLKEYFNERNLIPKRLRTEILKSKGEDRIKKVRNLFILRWTPDDIKKGCVKLIDGTVKTLEACVMDKSIMKIDIIQKVGNQFAEISENYFIKIGDRQNFSESPTKDETIAGFEDEIHYYSKVDSFKALKRLFSLLSFEGKTKNKAKLNKLVEFFNSQIGYLNKIKNEISILEVLLEQKRKPKWEDVIANLQFIKEQISQIYKVPIGDKVFKTIDEIKESNSLQTIRTLKDYFREKINQNSKDFLRSII
jgi:hypothetical protein